MGYDKSNDFKFFTDNYDLIFKKYGHKFIVIKNEKILGAYEDVDEALDETTKTEKLGTFIVQECTGDKSIFLCTAMRFCIS